MLRKMLSWRQDQGVDKVLEGTEGEERSAECLKYMTYYDGLQDKEGRPVTIPSTTHPCTSFVDAEQGCPRPFPNQ